MLSGRMSPFQSGEAHSLEVGALVPSIAIESETQLPAIRSSKLPDSSSLW